MAEDVTRTERSYCRVCNALCGILVDVKGEQVIRVRGDRDHPLSRGYTCPKGRALPRLHHHPQRLERPLVRIGGSLQPTSWEDCLDDLGRRLCDIIDRHGPSAVGIYFGSGNGFDAAGFRMSQALQAAIGTPARFTPMTIDAAAKTLVETLMAGVPGLHQRPDYDQVNLVIYIGVNPMVSHGHIIGMPNPALTIRTVAKRGEVWVIDPRRTETAKFANHHIAPRPGTDYAILGHLVREILCEGASQEVMTHRAVGAEALCAAVAPFNRARAAEIAGVSPDDLTTLLASVRKAGRLAVETGTGATMPATGNLTQWFAWALMIITDSMNRPGGVWFHPGFIKPLDAAPVPIVTEPFGPGPKSRPELQSFVGDWPCAALADEINAGNIRAFINLGGAMIRAFPDVNALRPALQRLEVFASLDIIENDTTALSTHVLPPKDQLERPDLMLWDTICPRVNMHYTPAVVSPVGERRSAWWILAEFIRRLGHEPPGALPADERAREADDTVLAAMMMQARCSFADIVTRRYIELKHELPARWIDAHIERLGGWRLAPAQLVDQLAAQSTARFSAEKTPMSLSLIPRRQRRHLNAYLLFLGDSPAVLLHPTDAASVGVQDGQPVIVRSTRGEFVGVARVDADMRPGVISVPHGYEDANVNLLTSTQQVDRLTGMALYSGFPVTLHPVQSRGTLDRTNCQSAPSPLSRRP
jgi:anaerobic selenocysteine-containing dehydrogenase